MKIIDTNTLNYIFTNNIKTNDIYYLAPDVKEESEIVEQIYGRRLPENIRDISNEPFFDQGTYIIYYKEMLNRYRGRSFYNMTGFGDISTLALLKMLREYIQIQPKSLFEEAEEKLTVITDDMPLRREIGEEFNQSSPEEGRNIEILSNDSIS